MVLRTHHLVGKSCHHSDVTATTGQLTQQLAATLLARRPAAQAGSCEILTALHDVLQATFAPGSHRLAQVIPQLPQVRGPPPTAAPAAP